MISKRHDDLRMLLQALAEFLDISDTQYDAAVSHYKAVGEWLNEENSSIVKHDPNIYSQGSFRLGTMIKPISDGDEYDIDLVCELKNLRKGEVSQKQLKDMIGDRLKENERYRKIIEECNRCWKLKYSDATRFHMDILPAIPADTVDDISPTTDPELSFSAILITDKELREWQRSNPIGFAEWFKERMRAQFEAMRMLVAKSLRATVEQIPDYKVKTPLQRSIQILKRHRDIMFSDDIDDKPISIIITTLAAHAYNNESDLIDALLNIVSGMPLYIEYRDGVTYIPNPTNPLENFADKWNPKKHPRREEKFRQWLEQVQTDLDVALRADDMHDIINLINNVATTTFPDWRSSAGVSATLAPQISISKPIKPWGK